LRKAVRASFFPAQVAAQEKDSYFPHLSLMYGEDDGSKKADEIIEKLLGADGKVKKVVGKEGWSVNGVEGFGVVEVRVVRCDGPPEEWKVLGEVPL
jgi:hypothetical protein